MASLCLSSSRIVSLHHQKPFLSLKLRPRPSDLSCVSHGTSAVCFSPLRLSTDRQRIGTVSARVEKRRKRGSSVVCYAAPMLSAYNLQWISTISCVALMLARGTGIHKSFVVPLFALQAPLGIVSWMKGEYGIWAAFLALLTRLFFSFPGELELPFIALLLVIVAPYQVMSIRGKQEGAILSLALSCFLAFQHFSRAGSLQKAFDQNSVLATVAIIGVTVVSFLFLVLWSLSVIVGVSTVLECCSGISIPTAVNIERRLCDTAVAELGSPVGSATPKGGPEPVMPVVGVVIGGGLRC